MQITLGITSDLISEHTNKEMLYVINSRLQLFLAYLTKKIIKQSVMHCKHLSTQLVIIISWLWHIIIESVGGCILLDNEIYVRLQNGWYF